MGLTSDSRIKLIADIVARLRAIMPDVIAVYRFGTWGTKAERNDSDLDLAVLAPKRLPAAQTWEIAQQLATFAGVNVDLVDLHAASTVMAAQIISKSERLYCSDEKRCVEYEDRTYSSYARLNEERREILQDIRKRGNVYGR
jgi:predicted nucleotidyltransferase